MSFQESRNSSSFREWKLKAVMDHIPVFIIVCRVFRGNDRKTRCRNFRLQNASVQSIWFRMQPSTVRKTLCTIKRAYQIWVRNNGGRRRAERRQCEIACIYEWNFLLQSSPKDGVDWNKQQPGDCRQEQTSLFFWEFFIEHSRHPLFTVCSFASHWE